MTSYELLILRRAQRELLDLPAGEYERVRDSITSLAQVPRPQGCLKLTGRDGWRIRVGVVRVIYDMDDNQRRVTVLHVGHRRDVYR